MSVPFRILLVVLLIVMNGFFASAEVALLSVRPSRLRQMAKEGHAGAQAALSLLAQPGRLLSVTQVGVTLASLGLGWAGEDGMYQFLVSVFQPLATPVTERYMHGLSFVLAFLVISYCHVVLGEVVPKNLAVTKADRLAALVAPALLVFYRLSTAFVLVLEGSAGAISRALRLKGSGRAGGHSAEELKLIVSSSRGLGYLPEVQGEIIQRILDLGAISAREIMVPRNDIVSIPASATLDEVLRKMTEERHSRLPVYQGSTEKIVGILHYKDLLPVWEERRHAIRGGRPAGGFHLDRLIRPQLVVPETKPLSQMLEDFRHARSRMAMVVDEFGTIVGLVTVADVIEQLVGRIEDEYDRTTDPRTAGATQVELDGTTRIRELDSEYGIEIPTDAGFETLAGFLLYRLGRIPEPGEFVDHQGRRFTVLEMERNRIARVRMEKLPERTPEETSGDGAGQE